MITDYAAEALTAFQERAPAIVHAQGATASKALKGLAIAELAVDSIQTQDFLHNGRGCRELDPIARPFVHSAPIATVAVAGVAYLVSRLPNRPWANALLGAFVAGEALNVAHNAESGCL